MNPSQRNDGDNDRSTAYDCISGCLFREATNLSLSFLNDFGYVFLLTSALRRKALFMAAATIYLRMFVPASLRSILGVYSFSSAAAHLAWFIRPNRVRLEYRPRLTLFVVSWASAFALTSKLTWLDPRALRNTRRARPWKRATGTFAINVKAEVQFRPAFPGDALLWSAKRRVSDAVTPLAAPMIDSLLGLAFMLLERGRAVPSLEFGWWARKKKEILDACMLDSKSHQQKKVKMLKLKRARWGLQRRLIYILQSTRELEKVTFLATCSKRAAAGDRRYYKMCKIRSYL